jgi:hypothetical protein
MSTDLATIIAGAPPGAVVVMLGEPYRTDAVVLGAVDGGIEILADADVQTVPKTTPATPVLDDLTRERLLVGAMVWLDLGRRVLERGDPQAVSTRKAMKVYAIERFHAGALPSLRELNDFISLLGLPGYQPSMTLRFTLRDFRYEGPTVEDVGTVSVGGLRANLSKIREVLENLSTGDAAVTIDAIELGPEPVHAYYRALPEPVLPPPDDQRLAYGATLAVSGGLDGTVTPAALLLLVDADWAEVLGAGDVVRVRRSALGANVTEPRHRLPLLATAVERLGQMHRELAARALAGTSLTERMTAIRAHVISRHEAGAIALDELTKFLETFGLAAYPERT